MPDYKACVLVHCAMGMSRSATATIMYIMRKFNFSLEDSFEYCKTQRDKPDPNEGFMEQLREFERNKQQFLSE